MYSYIPACCCVVCCYRYCRCCSCCCLLLLLVIVRRMEEKFVPVVHCIWFQCFLSPNSNTIYFQCTPWQHCRIFSVDFFTCNTCHTSSVSRAWAEPRRALARRGVSPLVISVVLFFEFSQARTLTSGRSCWGTPKAKIGRVSEGAWWNRRASFGRDRGGGDGRLVLGSFFFLVFLGRWRVCSHVTSHENKETEDENTCMPWYFRRRGLPVLLQRMYE